jgi:hypothetical protein
MFNPGRSERTGPQHTQLNGIFQMTLTRLPGPTYTFSDCRIVPWEERSS